MSDSYPVSYQLHSVNDVREWPALFSKGATALKVDPHYVVTSKLFLLSHDRPTSHRRRPTEDDGGEDGEGGGGGEGTDIALESSSSSSSSPPLYSTSSDLLSFFTSDLAAPLRGRTITVALCFKVPKGLESLLCAGSAVNESSSVVRDFLLAASDFFALANRTVVSTKDKHDVTLRFVLDGALKPCGCLEAMFEPWPSVFIDGDAGADKGPCDACKDSDEGHCSRFRVLNNPSTADWQSLGTEASHYHKFGYDSSTFLQLWEPDDQLSISSFIQSYVAGREAGTPSGRGLAFAINVDPRMFDVLSSGQIKGTYARGYDEIVGVGAETGSHRPVLFLSNSGGEETEETEEKHSDVKDVRFTMDYTIDGRGRVRREISASSDSFQEIAISEAEALPADGGKAEAFDSDADSALSSCLLALGGECWLTAAQRQEGLPPPLDSTATATLTLPDGDAVDIAFFSAGARLYGAARRRAGKSESSESESSPSPPLFRLIGLGRSVSTSVSGSDLLLSASDGHCYNSHEHNTAAGPQLVCDPKVKDEDVCPYSLTYTVGEGQDWYEWLVKDVSSEDTESSTSSVITACNSKLLHGTYSLGSNPSCVLRPFAPSSSSDLAVYCAYESYPLDTESPCGTPLIGFGGSLRFSAFAVRGPPPLRSSVPSFAAVEAEGLPDDADDPAAKYYEPPGTDDGGPSAPNEPLPPADGQEGLFGALPFEGGIALSIFAGVLLAAAIVGLSLAVMRRRRYAARGERGGNGRNGRFSSLTEDSLRDMRDESLRDVLNTSLLSGDYFREERLSSSRHSRVTGNSV